MQKIYLLTPNYLRENSEVSDDVEDKFISRSILTAQDIDLQRVLGTELYEIVIDAVYEYVNTGTTIPIPTRIENILDDYCLPIVLYSALRSVIPFIYIKMSPKTVGTNDGGYTQPVDYDIMKLFTKEYDNNYQSYVQRLINYLTVNSTDYEEWAATRLDDGEPQNMAPGSKNYFSGLQI